MRQHLDYPDGSMYAFVRKNAAQYADACALEYFGKKITYRRLLDEIGRCAGALRAMGVKKGDAVSLCLPNIPQAVIAFYAINCIGAVANMIHPLSAEEEIRYALTLSESCMLIALDRTAEKIERIRMETPVRHVVYVSVDSFMPLHVKLGCHLTQRTKTTLPAEMLHWHDLMAKGSPVPDDCGAQADDCAAILYSGGTTGRPKGIMLSNRNFNAVALQSIESCGCLQRGDRVLSVMPIFHGFGLGICIHTVLNFGGTAVILPQFKAAEYHKLLFRYKPNVIAGVPAIYENMIRSDAFAGRDLSYLRCIISGGDSLSVSTKEKLNRLLAAHGCNACVREGYGLTECVTGSCLSPEPPAKPESIGLPYPDTIYRILDPETGAPMKTGETGEIVLRGPSVMLGYLKEPEETARTLVSSDGHVWLHTGDLGYMDEEGYVYFRQRRKRMIVSGGYNIYPQMLEEIISTHPEVSACAVVGIPDEIMGQRVRAYAVLADPSADAERIAAEIMEMLQKKIARYALPRGIDFLPALPRTLVGKIAYTELMKGGACEHAES
ncbi:MAG: long-chain fatty acid--CoA ligase [Ruminococcus sp.]|nr:long-chain fatty acid--CoA ligase [Ruminococcus sp.]